MAAVKENRAKHITEYKEAVAGYKRTALESIERVMDIMRRRIESLKEGEMIRLDNVAFNLVVPESHEKDYDQAICMLEMSVDTELVLRYDEFAKFVMDDWDWKEQFTATSNFYNGPQRR